MNYTLYNIRILCSMALCMLLFSASPVHAAFLVKKQATGNKILVLKNLSITNGLSARSPAVSGQKNVFFSKVIRFISGHIPGTHKEMRKHSIGSILSLVFGCLSFVCMYATLIIGLSAEAFPALSIAVLIWGALFAIGGITLGTISWQKDNAKGMGRAGVIISAIMINLIMLIAIGIALG